MAPWQASAPHALWKLSAVVQPIALGARELAARPSQEIQKILDFYLTAIHNEWQLGWSRLRSGEQRHSSIVRANLWPP